MSPSYPREPILTKVWRLLWRLSGRRQTLDRLFTSLMRYRRYLPVCEPGALIPDLDQTGVRITQVPMGVWSTPLVDVFVILKAALGFQSRRILELGSYRGHTARLLAENSSEETRIVTVDVDPRHGEAYAGLPIARKIERRVGPIARDLFQPEERFDFIFVDANHDFASVINDSQVALGLLAPGGVIFWHDYHHVSYFHGMAGVPEALSHLAKDRAIVALSNTTLALYSEHPGWETAHLAAAEKSKMSGEVWSGTDFKG